MKVCILHYWLVTWRGGEKVVEALLELYPEADIYTHVYDEVLTEGKLKDVKIYTTFINKLPNAKKYYQKYLPLMPMALEQLDLREYDLIISSESGPAKGVITRPDALHVCYCHTPMRYVWDMYPDYIKSSGFLTRLLMRPFIHYLKMWDCLSANRVDYFISNSKFVAKRINKFYRREAETIHPPVDINEFTIMPEKSDYYLFLGQLTSYKRADLVVDAFLENGKKLVVIGEGEQFKELKLKENKNIQVLGRKSWSECKHYLHNAKALVFPGVEDFGMVPIEAMACGTPVLAYAMGGAVETVVDKETGFLFNDQTVSGLNACIEKFENEESTLDVNVIRKQAERFSKDIFLKKISAYIDQKLPDEIKNI